MREKGFSAVKRFAPWLATAVSLPAMVLLSWLFHGPGTYFGGRFAGLLIEPLYAVWLIGVLVLARRAVATWAQITPDARRNRLAGMLLGGLLLAAPVFWRLISTHDWWFPWIDGNPSPPMNVFFTALLMAGEALMVVGAMGAASRGRPIALRTTLAAVSFVLLVVPPDAAPPKLTALPALIASVAAEAVHRLAALEQRFPLRVWSVRAVVFLLGGGVLLSVVLASFAPGAAGWFADNTQSAQAAMLAASAFAIAGLLGAYAALAFAVSDVVGKLIRPFRSVRTRMVVLGVIAAAVGFGLRGLHVPVHAADQDGEQPFLATGLRLAVASVLVWIFALAMARRLSRSLEQSVSALGAVRAGDLSVKLPETGEDELSEVAQSFNSMVAQLREAEFLEQINEDLRKRSARLQMTLEALRTAQADLVKAERMASVATLVRGIAHELNNPIGFIAGNVPVLRKYCQFLARAVNELSDGKARSPQELKAITELSSNKNLDYVVEDLAKMTDDIAEGARRASLIISDLQSLTAASQRGIERVDLHRVVRQTVSLLKPRLTHTVRIETDLEPVPPLVARAGQLEQVLVNLVDNAIRAVGSDGLIRIRVHSEGDSVHIAVSDNGSGMSPEVKQHALEPFFTTRAPGEGSGLGLAIAASIVRGHRGTLTLESELGRGTEVHISLSATPDLAVAAETGAIAIGA